MKCDELIEKIKQADDDYRHKFIQINLDIEIEDVLGAFAELKKTIDKLTEAKKSAEQILQNLLDCGLIKEWYFNGKFNAILKADDPHLQIAELKQKLEDVQASMYCDVVDANMEIRRLKRALWMHRAITAKMNKEACKAMREYNPFIGIDEYKWQEVECKCRAKAEEYK